MSHTSGSRRTLTPGSIEYVWARITETTGLSLDAVGIELAVVTAGARPAAADWTAADRVVRAGRIVRAARLFDASAVTAGSTFDVFARITDSPEVIVLRCGSFSVA